MTFYKTIQILLKNINHKLNSPIHVFFYFYNANYIVYELDSRHIDEILNDKIPNPMNTEIRFIKDRNTIDIISYDAQSIDSCVRHSIKNNSHNLNIEKDFIQIKQTIITQDNKYKIHLVNMNEDEIIFEKDGFIHHETYSFYEKKYDFGCIELPKLENYKYQNLYNYKDEDTFINAILVEFILRQIRYNKIVPDVLTIPIQAKESESEYESELREYQESQNIEKNINDVLENYFGLTYYEVNNLKFFYNHYSTKVFQSDNITILLKSPPSSIRKNDTNLELSKEELINQLIKDKEQFDKEKNSCLNLNTKLPKEYLDKANKILKKFPITFKVKQKQLIEALFIFDYIQARKENIDHWNNQNKNTYSTQGEKGNHIPYPKMNPKDTDNIFSEITQEINIAAGQARKIHNHIHKFLEQKIP